MLQIHHNCRLPVRRFVAGEVARVTRSWRCSVCGARWKVQDIPMSQQAERMKHRPSLKHWLWARKHKRRYKRGYNK